MIITGDYHTHTTYSHGKGSILSNAQSAKQRGLKEIGISDHGFCHFAHPIKRADFSNIKKDIIEAEEKTGLKVYFGIEANFVSVNGDVDVTKKDLEKLDYLIVGQHRFVRSKFIDKIKLFLPNILGIKSKKQIERNTNCVLRAMEKYPIDIIAHLNYRMPVDAQKVGKKAVETNTLIELNTSKNHLSDEQILTLRDLGVKFVLSSDAHRIENVGKVERAMNKVIKLQIPVKQVVNLNSMIKFKKQVKK